MKRVKNKIKKFLIPHEINEFRPYILRSKFVTYFAVLVIILKLLNIGFFVYLPGSAYFSAITTNNLLELINQSRKEHNLPPLEINSKLNQSAYLKAKDMLEKDYFAHTSPDQITPWYWFKLAGYNYHYAGENLAIDFLDAKSLHTAFLNSPSHRANILNPNYKEVGIAVITGEFNGKQTTIAVEHFGTEFAPQLAKKTSQPTQVQTPKKSEQPEPAKSLTEINFSELEKQNLASKRETQKEPILTTPEEKVFVVAQEKIKEFEDFANRIQSQKTPKILGVLAEKSDEITNKLYLYSILFFVFVLLLNIFIKLEVQDKKLILNSLLIIILLIVLIAFNEKGVLNIGLNII